VDSQGETRSDMWESQEAHVRGVKRFEILAESYCQDSCLRHNNHASRSMVIWKHPLYYIVSR
jgi:hypothetical protein